MLDKQALIELLTEAADSRDRTGIIKPLSTFTCQGRLVLNDETVNLDAVTFAGLLYNAAPELLKALQGDETFPVDGGYLPPIDTPKRTKYKGG